MTTVAKNKNPALLLLPLAGIFIFVILFVIAMWVYPGGNPRNEQAKGFSLIHNYLCNLLSESTLGVINPSRPIAIAALFSIVAALALFWYFVPLFFERKSRYQKVIQYAGVFSMLSNLFLFTSYHDAAINISGIPCLIALLLTLRELYLAKQYGILQYGLVSLVAILAMMFVYYTKLGIYYLPIIQKIALLLSISWFIVLILLLYRKAKTNVYRQAFIAK